MPNVLTVDTNGVRIFPDEKRIRYTLTLSGAYVQAVRGSNVGELIDLTKALNPSFQAEVFWGQKGPTRGYVMQGGIAGNDAEIIPGADSLHWLLKVFSSANTELGAGAYNAAVTGDLDIIIEFTGRNFD